jgi:hypothetical protein
MTQTVLRRFSGITCGEIHRHVSDDWLLMNHPKEFDISKLKLLLFDMSSKKYWSMGNEIANCWNIGKQLKTEKT